MEEKYKKLKPVLDDDSEKHVHQSEGGTPG